MNQAEAGVVPALVITCEHGGNRIPARYKPLFRSRKADLESHRGWDRGALMMARTLARAFSAPLVCATVSRLLVDLNRSPGHPGLHDAPIRAASRAERQAIVARYHRPYREMVEDLVTRAIALRGQVVHVSCHSFTPELDGRVRTADIGLLYDPRRAGEVALCAAWKAALLDCSPGFVVRRNYPYLGKGDGLTASLRSKLSPLAYVGVEVEINQKHALAGGRPWAALRRAIEQSLHVALAGHPSPAVAGRSGGPRAEPLSKGAR